MDIFTYKLLEKNNKKLFLMQIIVCIFFTLNYGFLNAKSALIVVIFEIFRDFLYLKFKKRNNIFIICLPFYIIISIITYENIISTLSIIASVFDSYALTKKNQKVVSTKYNNIYFLVNI